jgi:hypothetical protein
MESLVVVCIAPLNVDAHSVTVIYVRNTYFHFIHY